MKEKLKSPKFWLTLSGAFILLLQSFGVKLDAPAVNEALTSISGLLLVAGVLSKDKDAAESAPKTDVTVKTDETANALPKTDGAAKIDAAEGTKRER
ncbi:MAG: hypothetical protein LBT20_02150 [Clostridiales bacterium]|jgi:uncharacterized membrane protein|nr:hypothetical protein [Clostridiales bacterium]